MAANSDIQTGSQATLEPSSTSPNIRVPSYLGARLADKGTNHWR